MDRTIGRLLQAVCVGDSGNFASQFRSSTWTSKQVIRNTVDAAIYHRIVPQLAEALAQQPAEAPLLVEVMGVYRSQTSHVLRLESLLIQTVDALSQAGVALAAFKGPAVAHRYYDTPAQRTYVDLDLLVSRRDMGQADEALKSAGLHPTSAQWQKEVDSGYGEVTYLGPDHTMLDLHWHPMREPSVRRTFDWKTADLLGRATTSRVAGLDLPVLDPEDMLIAVATHACYDGAYRLGWLLDVARIERSGLIRWDVLAQRCGSTGLGLPVQVVLDRARRTLGYSPHESQPYGRAAWRALIATLGTIRPVQHTFGQAGRGGVVFRSTRRTSGASIAALATLLLEEVAKPYLLDPDHRWKRPRLQRDRATARA